jgi:eukaryotic-like serine/threonine-protein kinase
MPDSDNQRNRELDDLLLKVLDLPPEERITFLTGATSHDPTLLSDVYKLLQYHDESLTFFGETLSNFLAPILPVLEGDIPDYHFEYEKDTIIGYYRIKKIIGKGGMGQVYLAERDDGVFRKEVALKSIKKGMDSEEILRRFRYERQILARLQHPNIATLLDGGLTNDGQPFFAMEYVNGIPINEYCDLKKLTIHERLTLFTHICDAVQYAHQQLVVHRDLKPSNILVTENGIVKLLDFGIARILDDDQSPFTTPVTKAGIRLMTIEYAAPEQVKNEQVSTATDIYTLGVLLLELLTGPVSAAIWKKPEKPSSIIEKNLAGSNSEKNNPLLKTISENRSASPEKLIRELKGDLDAIVLTAIREDPADRYRSAEILKQDLLNYLNNQPVSARKDSAQYRVKKFVRRHKAAAAVTMGLIILTISFVAVISYQLKIAAEERNRAQTERDRAEEITNLMVNLFNASDPMAPQKMDSLSVREFLDYSLSSIRTDFYSQPELKARLLNVMGSVYKNLGIFDIAESIVREGLDLRMEIYGPQHLDVAESQTTLGILQWELGLFENSLELHSQALATRKKLASDQLHLLAQNYHNLSIAQQRIGNLQTSDSLAQIAVDYFQGSSQWSNVEMARSLENLAIIRYRLGMYDEAILLQKSVINTIKDLQFGQRNFEYADALSNLGIMLIETGRYEEAHEALNDALEIQLNEMGEEHSRTSFFLHNMGWVLKEMGKLDESEKFYRRALDSKIQHLGHHHPSTILTQSNLAVLLWAQGNLDGAEPVLQEVLTARRQLFSDDHIDVMISLYNLGAIHNQRGDFITAGIYLEEVHKIAASTLADGHVVLSFIESEYGSYFTETGQFESAELYLTKSLSDFRQVRTDDDEMVKKTIDRIITLYERWNKPEEAEKYRMFTSGYPSDN